MTFIKKHTKYILIFAMLLNISCVGENQFRSSYSAKNESSKIQKGEKTHNEQGCDLIWNIRHENQREIFFRNTCTNRSCMVTWQSVNFSGIRSSFHYDYIPPQSEVSHPVSLYDVNFEVDYHFQ
ncbi:MAG: hypothetical protein FWD60_03685 [Candidatus Azobacteroides sp.]|nr:hypothetical protein [Candidatus Azobacteroides sp.]